MKRLLLGAISMLIFAAPALFAQNSDQIEVGAFADYFRLSTTTPVENFAGIGGRFAVAIRPSVQIEAEMAYDFKRSFTQTYSNGISTELVPSKLRPLHGYFGPKFQTGSGAFRVFVTGKVGFENFSITNSNPTAGFTKAVGLTGTTQFAIYPGGGFEAFAGPIGIRGEAGDDIYFQNGAHNNLRVTLGPQFRF
jgi:opacity protein-like surface antigen